MVSPFFLVLLLISHSTHSLLQNEKKMQLTQQETNKVKERDEQHTVELREWRVEIAKLKQVQMLQYHNN